MGIRLFKIDLRFRNSDPCMVLIHYRGLSRLIESTIQFRGNQDDLINLPRPLPVERRIDPQAIVWGSGIEQFIIQPIFLFVALSGIILFMVDIAIGIILILDCLLLEQIVLAGYTPSSR